MKTVSILNLKGGVGKTVTAVNMAAILATEHQKRVLVIDADPQANASRFFGVTAENGGLTAVLDGNAPYYENLILRTIYQRVDILPCDMSLLNLDVDTILNGPRRAGAIADLRDALIEDDAYDIVLIDCPPSFTAASVAAIAASSGIIIPIKLDAFSLAGMSELAIQIAGVRKLNPMVRVEGCLITMWHNCEVVRLAEAQLRSGDVPVFSTVIRRTDKVDESTFACAALTDYSKWSSAAKDYRAFVAEWLGKEGLLHGEEV